MKRHLKAIDFESRIEQWHVVCVCFFSLHQWFKTEKKRVRESVRSLVNGSVLLFEHTKHSRISIISSQVCFTWLIPLFSFFLSFYLSTLGSSYFIVLWFFFHHFSKVVNVRANPKFFDFLSTTTTKPKINMMCWVILNFICILFLIVHTVHGSICMHSIHWHHPNSLSFSFSKISTYAKRCEKKYWQSHRFEAC